MHIRILPNSLDEKKKKKKKDDRCTRIAKRKYDVWPSAYASGAVVKCRKGKIWKDLKEEEILNMLKEELESFLDEKKKKAGTESSKESSLHDWFGRKGAKGKSSGWVDCNTCRKDKKTGRKTCKSCGRKEGEKRSKYPACRPTPAACGERGRGKSWGKKSKTKSEALQMHISEGVGVDRNFFRPGSDSFFAIIREARELYNEGEYTPVNEEERDILENFDLGEVVTIQGEKIPLDFPMLNEEILDEEKDPPIGKPTKNSGSGKKYKVYVRNPKTGRIKKITYGDSKGGLKGNWNNAEARKSFAARHNCAEKSKNPNRRLTAGYWACRAHKDFGTNVPGRFW